MCGFCAFYDKTKIENKKKIIKDMADRIKHRGPDSDGYYVDKDIAMGFRRLSIIDLKGGNQPLYNEDNSPAATISGVTRISSFVVPSIYGIFLILPLSISAS